LPYGIESLLMVLLLSAVMSIIIETINRHIMWHERWLRSNL
jgi:hypothetical protein